MTYITVTRALYCYTCITVTRALHLPYTQVRIYFCSVDMFPPIKLYSRVMSFGRRATTEHVRLKALTVEK